MALNIEVFDKFYIASNKYDVIVYRKTEIDPTVHPNWEKRKAEGASPDIRIENTDPRYFSTIEQALQYIAESMVRDSEASTLEELLNEIREIRREINDVLSF